MNVAVLQFELPIGRRPILDRNDDFLTKLRKQNFMIDNLVAFHLDWCILLNLRLAGIIVVPYLLKPNQPLLILFTDTKIAECDCIIA